jgi:hypothetical protein
LSTLLALPKDAMLSLLKGPPADEPALGHLLPPLDPMHEVWAGGVTYLRSRQARQAESGVGAMCTPGFMRQPAPSCFSRLLAGG